jgi:hydrogenase expression/formation protein HypD
MKYIDEFRDPALARRLVEEIRRGASQRDAPVQLMEFCGGHTHAIFRFGLRETLAPGVEMRSGPGCPVCVTAAADLDRAIALAEVSGVTLATFGDMVRVPGSRGTLQDARARGADVRIVYSPLDALALARENPAREVVFLGVGFETTAPGVAATVAQAHEEGLDNFSVLSLHKLTPPAMRAILDAGEVALDGIVGPGHVSAVVGSDAWRFLPRAYGMPVAVAGFEPLDLLGAVSALVGMAVGGEARVVNAYGRGVRAGGNPAALEMLDGVFEPTDAAWRGFGVVPHSGLVLRPAFSAHDAARRFPLDVEPAEEPAGCLCGEVLRGVVLPPECPLFRSVCSPRNPIGPCMVSAEGSCAAYYKYGEGV